MTDSTPEGDVLSTAEREGIVDQQDAVLAAMDRREGRDLAVVTGASSGIGLELSKQFAKHGFDLLVAAEDEGIARAAAEIRAMGAEITDVRVDLATADARSDRHQLLCPGRPGGHQARPVQEGRPRRGRTGRVRGAPGRQGPR